MGQSHHDGERGVVIESIGEEEGLNLLVCEVGVLLDFGFAVLTLFLSVGRSVVAAYGGPVGISDSGYFGVGNSESMWEKKKTRQNRNEGRGFHHFGVAKSENFVWEKIKNEKSDLLSSNVMII